MAKWFGYTAKEKGSDQILASISILPVVLIVDQQLLTSRLFLPMANSSVEVAFHRLETVAWWNDLGSGAPVCRIYSIHPTRFQNLDSTSPETIANITLPNRLNEVLDNICPSVYRD